MKLPTLRSPALESAQAGFGSWWAMRSVRERWMLGGLALLLGVLVLVFGIVRPLQAARAQAFQDIRTYETLTARLRAAGPAASSASGQPQPRSGDAMQVVTASSTSFGIVATVEPVPGTGVRATVADAPYDMVMAWISDMAATSNLKLRRVQMTRRPTPGRVAATVDFAS